MGSCEQQIRHDREYTKSVLISFIDKVALQLEEVNLESSWVLRGRKYLRVNKQVAVIYWLETFGYDPERLRFEFGFDQPVTWKKTYSNQVMVKKR